jgi:3-hydroxyisobutyrate dehydrogenase
MTTNAGTRIGFYGLGDIGLPMATNLYRSGADLRIYNRTRAKADALAAEGARVADSVAQLVGESDVLITCLHGPEADRAAYLAPGGILAGDVAGKLLINTSTIGPELAVQLAEAARAAGAEYLDCPILGGGRVAAGTGELIFPVGGLRETFERALPVLAVLARQVEYVGDAGTAQVIKLANNSVWAITSVALAQAVRMALAARADPNSLDRVLAAQTRTVTPAMNYLTAMVRGETAERGTFRTLAKDLDLANTFARSVGENPSVGDAAAAVFRTGLDAGQGRLDVPSLVRIDMQLNNRRDDGDLTGLRSAGAPRPGSRGTPRTPQRLAHGRCRSPSLRRTAYRCHASRRR